MINLENNLLVFQIVIAFILDLIIGDPYWFPHPVRGIGALIKYCETALRNMRLPERLAGILLLMSVVSIVYFITLFVINYLTGFGKIFHIAASIIVIYFTFSVRSLIKEAKKIVSLLESDDLNRARKEMSNIVGRDTENMDRIQIKRACIESLAENMVDGIISPIFYAFIGGAPFAMAYKAVNTLDSMVGYKNERYLRLGWASARFDDAANFLPARIARLIIPVASFFCGVDPYNSLKIAFRDGHKHPSPNSGIPEAAFAGALKIQLGGSCSYNGIESHKPLLGDSEEQLSIKKIKKTIQIVYIGSCLAIFTGVSALIVINIFLRN